MGVIQYRRGERFDKVIVSKIEDPRASSMVVRLNTHTFKRADTAVATSVASPLPEDRSLAAVLKRAVEASAQQSNDPTVRDVFKPSAEAAQRSREEAQQAWSEMTAKTKESFKASPIKFVIFAFIAFQILRAIFDS